MRLLLMGDQFIDEKAEHWQDYNNRGQPDGFELKPGNAETWLRATINHHMSVMVNQLAGL